MQKLGPNAPHITILIRNLQRELQCYSNMQKYKNGDHRQGALPLFWNQPLNNYQKFLLKIQA